MQQGRKILKLISDVGFVEGRAGFANTVSILELIRG